MELRFIDYLVLGLYSVYVLAVGYTLKGQMRTSEDFFLSGRSLPSWITGLAFMAANLGALEVMGMSANGAKYGMLTNHFYWVGAIPAMVFLALFMMPFYYSSRIRSVPEYLKLRFDEKTRGLNAISFAVMTVMMSGINMYAMALVLNLLLGWSIHASIVLSAGIVLIYIFFGGLTSSIYNEVLQFFLIVFGLLPLAFLGLSEAGGFEGLAARLSEGFVHTWSVLADPDQNPMGVGWFGTVMGLGFVLSFGYWCTDFLVVQRAMASKDLLAAQRTPLIAAIPKMLFPLLVILPGLVALLTIREKMGDNYNLSLPLLLAHYYPPGMLGLGLTALLASFMSGMAGNVTAFNTVWTYDIYQSYLRPHREDAHYLSMGRAATVFGTLASVGAAYLVLFFDNLMDYMQLLFSFFNAPLFATFLLGMFWARSTATGAFYGLVAGILAAGVHYLLTVAEVLSYRSDMAANYFGAITAWTTCFTVTILLSLAGRARPAEELVGLVYSVTPRARGTSRPLSSPLSLAVLVLLACTALNLWFW
jgi:SSS family solute:Na+ symporter